MRHALEDAAVPAAAIDYINAHATSTSKGDVSEANAVRLVFGEHAEDLTMSATKSMTGHLLGAAGAVELIVALLAMRDSVVPPTLNLDHPGEEFAGLQLAPNVAVRRQVDFAISNSFGFGGHNVSIVVGKRPYEA